jgi:hypothetical protein
MGCVRRSSKPLSKDANQLAAEIVSLSTEEPRETTSVKEYLSSIGRKGGLKGGKARAKKLNAETRQLIAKNAAKARWSRKPKK